MACHNKTLSQLKPISNLYNGDLTSESSEIECQEITVAIAAVAIGAHLNKISKTIKIFMSA
jgi:hypothetical protein